MASHHREPVKHSCPEIDKYIRNIKGTLGYRSSSYTRRYLQSLNQEDLLSYAEDMAYELERCIDYLESVRVSNDALRQWGIEEAEKVDELESEVHMLNQMNSFD